MMTILQVSTNVLREAVRRRWLLALVGLLTALLLVLVTALRFDVVDGALAAVSLFGRTTQSTMLPVDVMLRPLIQAIALLVYASTLVLPTLLFSEFAPALMSPGRVESLLALPIRRYQLVIGIFFGVWLLALIVSLYGSVGLTLVLGAKTGIWTLGALRASMVALVAWSSTYAFMLAAATLVRSATLSVVVGLAFSAASAATGVREKLLDCLSPGLVRSLVAGLSAPFPRTAALGRMCVDAAGSIPIDIGTNTKLLAGCLAFTAAGLLLSIWFVERRDY